MTVDTGPVPRLTFACELDPVRLVDLFADASVVGELRALDARVALMLSDLSVERASVVQQLNHAGVPVVGIPLLPLADGYYFTADNALLAKARYEQWRAWTAQHHLVWDAVGLDVEPDARFYLELMASPWRLARLMVPRLADRRRPARSRADYAALVDRIRADGWMVENYQFPLIADERRAGSTLLQRLALVELRTDREVWMLYSSFMRGIGPALIWSYGPQAAAIGVGTTGGGPDIPGSPQLPSLSWVEFARDLRLARRWCPEILIHSLEGCVRHGFLPRLRNFDWDAAVARPRWTRSVRIARHAFTATLWAGAHPYRTALAAGILGCLVTTRRDRGRRGGWRSR